jgi:hypothetical protein
MGASPKKITSSLDKNQERYCIHPNISPLPYLYAGNLLEEAYSIDWSS